MHRFEVLIRDHQGKQAVTRQWTKSELMNSVAWLKRMNARGNDVYVRPAGQHGLVLIEGLKAEDLVAMRRKGFEPAVTIESGPGAFEVWVALSDRPLPDQVRALVATGLVRAFGSDAGDPDDQGYGRLAGFTVHDRQCGPDAKRRFALAHAGTGMVASSGAKYLEHIDNTLRDPTAGRGRSAGKKPRDKALRRGR